MIIFPAVDIKDGKCVRLMQGDFDKETVYSENPVDMALKWEGQGAKYLHVVDLDGAKAGSPQNLEIIKEIIKEVNIPVQVGGGIRTIETAQSILELGAKRIIMGTAAIKNPEILEEAVKLFDEKLVVGIDAKNRMVAVEGWGELSEYTLFDFASRVDEMGVKTIIYTDISRDGTLQGSDIVGITELLSRVYINVIVSGGINDIQDLKRLNRLGVNGAIIGKALYTGEISLLETFGIDK